MDVKRHFQAKHSHLLQVNNSFITDVISARLLFRNQRPRNVFQISGSFVAILLMKAGVTMEIQRQRQGDKTTTAAGTTQTLQIILNVSYFKVISAIRRIAALCRCACGVVAAQRPHLLMWPRRLRRCVLGSPLHTLHSNANNYAQFKRKKDKSGLAADGADLI